MSITGGSRIVSGSFIHTLAFGVRGRGRSAVPYAALVVPLDDEFEFIEVIATAGLQVALG